MTNASRIERQTRENAFDIEVSNFLKSYFDNGFDSSVLISFLRDHEDQSECFDLLVVKIIRKAFDTNELWVIESIAGLFVVAVSSGLVTRQMVSRAFEKLFHLIDDLAMDVPGIYDTVVELICTGIDDSILPENYLSRTPINVLKSLINEQRKAAMKDTISSMESFRQSARNLVSGPTTEFWNLGLLDAQEELKIFIETSKVEGCLMNHELIRPLIVTSMTMSNQTREIVSQLLSVCTGSRDSIFSTEDVVLAFARIFLYISDTKLDIPNVQSLLAKFLARSIIDEVIPPSFLRWTQRLRIGGEEGGQVLRLVEDWIDPETRKNLGVKYENIWKGSDPLSDVAIECRRVTRLAVNELYDNDDCIIAKTVTQIQNNALTPDLATVCVRVIIESILERDNEGRIVAIAVALLKKLKQEHEIDGTNIRDAMEYLNSPERKAELAKDVGELAVNNLGRVEEILRDSGLDLD